MHSSKLLKICKVESPAFAKYCVQRGADYLGVHCLDFMLDESKRELCEYISAIGGKVVLLTKETDPAQLQHLLDFYKPWALQLHYPLALWQYRALAGQLKARIVPVFTDETSPQDVLGLLRQCDLAVYDTSYRGGTGRPHARKHLLNMPDDVAAKVLLAGGITATSAQQHMQDKIGGFDVQSFCRQKSAHHYGRAEQLLQTVKGQPVRKLSVSLTDVEPGQYTPPYPQSGCLEYQVDYSEGGLYPQFSVSTQKILDIIKQRDAPFTLHIFEKNVHDFQQVIDDFTAAAGNKLVRINIQYSPDLDVDAIKTYDAKKCLSLYYRDLEAYMEAYPNLHECISFILPSKMLENEVYLARHAVEIEAMASREMWFDRKVDAQTISAVLQYDGRANFIAGNYVLQDWSHEAQLVSALEAYGKTATAV